MGFAELPRRRLRRCSTGGHRELVATEFDALLHGRRRPRQAACGGAARQSAAPMAPTARRWSRAAAAMRDRAWRWASPACRRLRDDRRLRRRLVQRTAPLAGARRCGAAGVRFGRLARSAAAPRRSYLALLLERPGARSACCACWARRWPTCAT